MWLARAALNFIGGAEVDNSELCAARSESKSCQHDGKCVWSSKSEACLAIPKVQRGSTQQFSDLGEVTVADSDCAPFSGDSDVCNALHAQGCSWNAHKQACLSNSASAYIDKLLANGDEFVFSGGGLIELVRDEVAQSKLRRKANAIALPTGGALTQFGEELAGIESDASELRDTFEVTEADEFFVDFVVALLTDELRTTTLDVESRFRQLLNQAKGKKRAFLREYDALRIKFRVLSLPMTKDPRFASGEFSLMYMQFVRCIRGHLQGSSSEEGIAKCFADLVENWQKHNAQIAQDIGAVGMLEQVEQTVQERLAGQIRAKEIQVALTTLTNLLSASSVLLGATASSAKAANLLEGALKFRANPFVRASQALGQASLSGNLSDLIPSSGNLDATALKVLETYRTVFNESNLWSLANRVEKALAFIPGQSGQVLSGLFRMARIENASRQGQLTLSANVIYGVANIATGNAMHYVRIGKEIFGSDDVEFLRKENYASNASTAGDSMDRTIAAQVLRAAEGFLGQSARAIASMNTAELGAQQTGPGQKMAFAMGMLEPLEGEAEADKQWLDAIRENWSNERQIGALLGLKEALRDTGDAETMQQISQQFDALYARRAKIATELAAKQHQLGPMGQKRAELARYLGSLGILDSVAEPLVAASKKFMAAAEITAKTMLLTGEEKLAEARKALQQAAQIDEQARLHERATTAEAENALLRSQLSSLQAQNATQEATLNVANAKLMLVEEQQQEMAQTMALISERLAQSESQRAMSAENRRMLAQEVELLQARFARQQAEHDLAQQEAKQSSQQLAAKLLEAEAKEQQLMAKILSSTTESLRKEEQRMKLEAELTRVQAEKSSQASKLEEQGQQLTGYVEKLHNMEALGEAFAQLSVRSDAAISENFRLAKQVESLEKAKSNGDAQIEHLTQSLADLSLVAQQSAQDLALKNQSLAQAQSQEKLLQQALEAANKQTQVAAQSLAQAETKLSQAEARVQTEVQAKRRAEESYAKAEAELAPLRASLEREEALKRKIEELRAEFDVQTAGKLGEYEAKLASKDVELTQTRAQYDTEMQKLAAMQEEALRNAAESARRSNTAEIELWKSRAEKAHQRLQALKGSEIILEQR